MHCSRSIKRTEGRSRHGSTSFHVVVKITTHVTHTTSGPFENKTRSDEKSKKTIDLSLPPIQGSFSFPVTTVISGEKVSLKTALNSRDKNHR
jgi:hypothetical protein